MTKTRFTRRAMLGVALATGLVATSADAKTIKVKHGTLAPKDSPWYNGMKKVGERWEKISGGDVELKIYAGGIVGDEGDMVRKMRIGQLQAATVTNIGLSRITRDSVALQIPMMFQSYEELDHVRERIAPRIEKALFDAGNEDPKNGVVVLNWGDAGWVHFFSKEKAVTPDDFRKTKLFVWTGDPEAEAAWKKANFNVVPMSATDVLSGLQTGMIESFSTAPVYALTSQWFGLAKHMVAIKWAPLNGATIISRATWETIPADLRPKLLKIAQEEGDAVKAEIRALGERSIDEMKKRGLTIHQVDAKTQAEWQAAAEMAYPAIRGSVVPAPLFDEVKRLVEEYRTTKK